MKCVTSSFQSLFRVLKEPMIYQSVGKSEKIYEENGEHLLKNVSQRAISRAATEATRTPTPKMLLDLKSGAIHWPVYQFGGQSGSGMLLSTKALTKKKNITGKISSQFAIFNYIFRIL